jgi:hypothetical protein
VRQIDEFEPEFLGQHRQQSFLFDEALIDEDLMRGKVRGALDGLGGAAAVGLRYDIGEPEALEARGQVLFRYCDAAGGPPAPKRASTNAQPVETAQLRLSSVPLIAPRERARWIAGVCGEAGNVVGVLAAAGAVAGLGAQLLASLRLHLRGRR